jgi:hypothetical protein
MENSEILAEVLKKIILEIRLLSSSENRNSSMDQINELANIAHNIPMSIVDSKEFDLASLGDSLKKYTNKYSSSGIFEDFLKIGN